MINEQGEIALQISSDCMGNFIVDGYSLPGDRDGFSRQDLQEVYLAAQLGEKGIFTEQEETTLDAYLQGIQIVNKKDGQFYGTITGHVSRSNTAPDSPKSVFAGKKYKPVALKTNPVLAALPAKFRIERNILGEPLKDMPVLNPRPTEFKPTGRYTQERKEIIDQVHEGPFLWPEERKAVHNLMMQQEGAFAWDDTERGSFKPEYFPPVEMPVIEHKPWVLKNIPIPPGIYSEVCKVIKSKIDAGVYEPSNSSYRSRWFCVIKKDGKSLRLVHSLEPLNEVTIAHSGIPPATDSLAEHFAGRACIALFDLYVGYDERLLATISRDLTTFQTPFGALRLVTLPMGWTNSVPIFHDDVTYILKDEIPHVTIPYIDDVPIRGPATRYELPGGRYETIEENPGIRRFVWEHLQNCNRVLQRLKYSGATVSGKKTYLCVPEGLVVGHRCTYAGRLPSTDRVGVVTRWGPCKDLSDVRAFLGTVGVCRMFIRDYAEKAEPLNRLTRKDVPFEWGPEQEISQQELKDALVASPALRPLDYSWDSPVYLAVDTSWKAVGYYIYQRDPDDPKKHYIARFGSVTLNDREAAYNQPKRELFGLMTALDEAKYWLLGVRNLIVETDAKYIKGMLNNASFGPNATINRWIEKILMFHFELVHVAGKTHGPDGLSRRDFQPGDPPKPPPDPEEEEPYGPPKFSMAPGETEEPLEFDDFKNDIDTRGGYLQEARSIDDFMQEVVEATEEQGRIKESMRQLIAKSDNYLDNNLVVDQFLSEPIIPSEDLKYDPEQREPYEQDHRTEAAKTQDSRLRFVRKWLKNPFQKPKDFTNQQYQQFARFARTFFLDKEDRLYKKSMDGPRLVVDEDHRMYMMKAAHDSLGHKGFYATKSLIEKRFWWPEIERDVSWYVRTCHLCQLRLKTLLRIPPIITHTPSIFEVLHVDTMVMSPKSNQCRFIVHGRCALTSWMEGRALRKETAKAIADWLFEDIICRWGCLREIVTDNGKQFKQVAAYLETKYGIKGISISAYNSQANGKIERPHWDVRQALWKACGSESTKWFWFFHHIMWSDRITIRKRFGCSPFFMVTGAHPVLPLDLIEATWLVKLPGRVLTDEELIGYRAKALAKHRDHVEEMRRRVDKSKRDALVRYERDHLHTIQDLNFKPGDLVLVRNTKIESNLDKKMKARYNGPMIVIKRLSGGAYIIAEMNGAVFKEKVGAFRLLPYQARRRIELPDNIQDLIEITPEALKELEESWNLAEDPEWDPKVDLRFENIHMDNESEEEDTEEEEDLDEDEPDDDEDE